MMRIAVLLMLLTLQACGRDAPPTAAAIAAQAETLRPAEARLAAVYERSCLACHGRAHSGAPLTGDAQAWAPRLAKGMEALLLSSQQGLGGMPAMGLCADCSDTDLRALIEFMSMRAEPQ